MNRRNITVWVAGAQIDLECTVDYENNPLEIFAYNLKGRLLKLPLKLKDCFLTDIQDELAELECKHMLYGGEL